MIELLKSWGIRVREEQVAIDDIYEAAMRGEVSEVATCSSLTRMPQLFNSSITDARVMPPRMLPFNAGVTASPFMMKKIFILPTSSVLRRSAETDPYLCGG